VSLSTPSLPNAFVLQFHSSVSLPVFDFALIQAREQNHQNSQLLSVMLLYDDYGFLLINLSPERQSTVQFISQNVTVSTEKRKGA
jgi:hypothetical protein